jgi:K+/H+ antiporter YhaU regulatory subunit KhtT
MVREFYGGPDCVLALATVSGQVVASELLWRELLSIETRIEAARTSDPDLAECSLAETNMRAETGVTVTVVEWEDGVLTGVSPSFVLK